MHRILDPGDAQPSPNTNSAAGFPTHHGKPQSGQKHDIVWTSIDEKLKQMLARRILLPTVHHRVRREFYEPVLRLMPATEQNLRMAAWAFLKPIPPVVVIP